MCNEMKCLPPISKEWVSHEENTDQKRDEKENTAVERTKPSNQDGKEKYYLSIHAKDHFQQQT